MAGKVGMAITGEIPFGTLIVGPSASAPALLPSGHHRPFG